MSTSGSNLISGTSGTTVPPSALTISIPTGTVVPTTQLSNFLVGGSCVGSGMSVQLSGASTATIPCNTGTWSTSINLLAAVDGSQTLTATLLPAPTNGVAPTTSIALIKDTQAPTTPVVSAPPNPIFVTQVSATWTAADVGPAGLDKTAAFTIGLYSGGTCGGAPIGTFTSATPSFTLSGLANSGVYSYSVTAKDAAGNVGLTACSSGFQVLSSAFSFTLSDPAANPGYALTQAAPVVSLATVPGAQLYCISEQAQSFPNGVAPCAGGLGSNSGWYNTTRNGAGFTLSAGDGTKTVYMWVADAGGNVKAATPAAIILDTAPLGSFSVLGLSGGIDTEVDGYLIDVSTPPATATVSWTASATAVQYSVQILDSTGTTNECTVATVGNVTSAALVGCTLSNSTAYKAKVTAINVAGGKSAPVTIGFNVYSRSFLTLAASPVTTTFPTPSTFNLVLTNTSLSLNISVSGFNSSVGAYVISGSCPVVAANSSCTLTVTYTPSAVGASLDPVTFTVTYDDHTSPGQTTNTGTSENVIPGSFTIAPTYASAPNWNDYVENNSPNLPAYSQGGAVCNGNETAGYTSCVHGGELRLANLSNIPSCAGYSVADTGGFFNWVCDSSGGSVKIFSTGLAKGKGLANLITTSAWNPPILQLSKGGVVYMQSTGSWGWTNPISLLSGTVSGPLAVTPYNIFTIASNLITSGVNLTVDHQSLVVMPTFTLKYDESGIQNCTAGGTPGTVNDVQVCSGNRFLWIEGTIQAYKTSPGLAADYGVFLANSTMSVVRQVNLSGGSTCGITLNSSYGARLLDTNMSGTNSNADGVCISGDGQAGRNGMLISGLTTFSNGNNGLNIGPSGGTDGNTFLSIVANGNTGNGVSFENGSNSVFNGLQSASNGNNGLEVDAGSANLFRSVETASNQNDGVAVNGASGNSFYDVRASDNANAGFSATQSSGGFVTRLLSTANYDGMNIGAGASGYTFHQLTLTQNNFGIEVGGTVGTPESNNVFSAVMLGGNITGIEFDNYSHNNTFENVVDVDNGSYGLAKGALSITGNAFTGYLAVGNNGANCALDSSCSTYTIASLMNSASYSLTSSFVGNVSSDSVNTSGGATGSAPYSTNLDWLGFQDSTRAWGGFSSIYDGVLQGACTSGTCDIWDFALRANDIIYRNSSAKPGTPNPAWPASNGQPCNNLVSGGGSVASTSGAGGQYLLYAVEMMDSGNPNNNGNGLCEAGETCIYSPNDGYYLGSGDPTTSYCTIQAGGTVTPGSGTNHFMYAYPVN